MRSILSLAVLIFSISPLWANDVNVGVNVNNNLTLSLGSLDSDPYVQFNAISYVNKSNPEIKSYGGILAYTTTLNRSVAITMTSTQSNADGNPYLILTGQAVPSDIPQNETEIPYSIELTSCHPSTGSATTLNLKNNAPGIIDYPNSYRNSCFEFLGGQPGTLQFTRLAIPGPLPVSGNYTGTVTFTLSLL